MKKLVVLAFLMGWLFSISGCASDTATTQEKKPPGWGTINTIESEAVRR